MERDVMAHARTGRVIAFERLSDQQLVELARAGESAAFGTIMQRHNRRLYRVARGILGEDCEAEDAVQETWMRAFQNLASWRGEAALTTWLTRIAINEALGRKRKRRPAVDVSKLDLIDEQGEARVLIFPGTRPGDDPEADASRAEVRRLLEHAIDDLPDGFRIVFVMRDVEQMSVEETASQLDIPAETVKTRLHRARRRLREALQERLGSVLQDTYSFDGERCERITDAVLKRLNLAAAGEN
jgi:RNA polymerase sigma-70 factor (ECF subfamily)